MGNNVLLQHNKNRETQKPRRITDGPPAYPVAYIGCVVLEAHCRWLLEGKRAEAGVDYLTTAVSKKGMRMGEDTLVAGYFHHAVFILAAMCWRTLLLRKHFVG